MYRIVLYQLIRFALLYLIIIIIIIIIIIYQSVNQLLDFGARGLIAEGLVFSFIITT